MTLTDDLAFRIYQSILDGSGDAVNLRDFSRYHRFFEYPSVLETFQGRMSVETTEELHEVFDTLQSGLREIGAERMIRSCTVAQFDGAKTIRGVHDTRLVDDKGRLVEAYCGMCTLNLADGHWRVSVCQFVEGTVSLPSKTLSRHCSAIDA